MTDSRRLEAVLATPPEQRLDAAITAVAEALEELRQELRRWREAQAKPVALAGWRAGGEPTGTSLAGYFPASYAQLVALLGEPAPNSDGYKVSTEWTFTSDADGQCVTLYDYKETNLYDPDLPSVADFRARPSHDWHIGARNRDIAQRFTDALKAALEH